jgi:aldose sugar dehydrogenase
MEMKYTAIAALMLLTGLCGSAQQPDGDAAAARQVIELYFDGWATGDTVKLGRAMHATCHLKSYRDGQFTNMSRSEYLSRFKPRTRPEGLVTRLVSLDITENIAAAKTNIDTGKDVFTDYFNLIRTAEGWFIVDKIAVRVTKKPAEK